MLRVQHTAELASARKKDPSRHKCFVSYHVDDLPEVEQFLDDFGSEFIPRSVGVTVEDDFIDSDDDDYIKRRIRELYLSDSTVTIVLLGQCTWGRRFVDWEISSSLRNDPINKRSGLLVYPLPSRNNSATLPARVKDNWVEGNQAASYVRYMMYPDSATTIRGHIESSFGDRNSKSYLVDNSRALRTTNSCP
ncbi:TIR domain-containing protein [Mycobacteroides franklinii]|nr:TIR domain-containing protein [Mycobacteroides franklinii]ORA62088.1 hypothetical protein BST24_08035 [Mycobacteroides franklinii]